MRTNIIWTAILVSTMLNAQVSKPPIIDMHMHSSTEIWSEVSPCFPLGECEGIKTTVRDPKELLDSTITQMDKHNIVLAVLSGNDLDESYRWAKADSRFIVGPMIEIPADVDLNRIRKDIEDGKIKIMGEITSQYAGLAINDPSLEKVMELASEFNIPVQAHVTGTGGGANFPTAKGDPLLVSEVIQKNPGLKIYMENAGFPYVDKTVSLMYTYPTAYGDLSTLTWIVPRNVFYKYLRELMEAGLGKRLMFGSDQMLWPRRIEDGIDAINSAEFLTDEEKRDIFYNNAARFLNLSEAEIKEHHEN